MRNWRRRSLYLVCMLVVAALGLGSRRFGDSLPAFLAAYAGDTLWALLVFLGLSFVAPRARTSARAAIALTIAYTVEVSQLYHAPWIDALRQTKLGGLVLGFGFLWGDLICYAVGVACGAVLESVSLRCSMSGLPTAEALVGPPPLGLDEKCALKNFLGKTRDQAEEMFGQNPSVTEDFSYMASAGLCYYLPAALSYLKSEDSNGKWEFAHGLMCALSVQVGVFGMRGKPLILMQDIAEYCDLHRSKFNFTPEDLFDRYLKAIRNASI